MSRERAERELQKPEVPEEQWRVVLERLRLKGKVPDKTTRE